MTVLKRPMTRLWLALLLTAALVGSGIFVSAMGAPNQLVYACVNNKSGTVKIVAAGRHHHSWPLSRCFTIRTSGP